MSSKIPLPYEENQMQSLSQQEIEQISGGKISVSEAAAATIGLMALAVGSPFVIGAGAVALVAYAWMS
jgi:hypothetical protein